MIGNISQVLLEAECMHIFFVTNFEFLKLIVCNSKGLDEHS